MKRIIATSHVAAQHSWLAALAVILALAALTGLHWAKNPFRLAVWVYANQPGFLIVESSCAGDNPVALRHRQAIVEGYFEYQLLLPRCVVENIKLASEYEPNISISVAATAVTYYGKAVASLFGPARLRAGEGIYTRETRPSRSDAKSLESPLVIRDLRLDLTRGAISWPRWLLLALIPVAAIIGYRNAARKQEPAAQLAYPLLLVAVLCLTASAAVAARSDVSVHPDELSHVASARYYYDHWLKPKIGDPETLDAHSASRYGFAYLVNPEPVYLLAAKFAILTWPIFENDVVALRAFNVTLFFVLVVLALRDPSVQLAAIPIIGIPQAWYVFSYFNGDGFPLFLSTLAVVAFLRPDIHRTSAVESPSLWRQAIFPGVLVGLLFLSKINYWTVLGFIALCIIARDRYLSAGGVRLLILGYLAGVAGVFYLLDQRCSEACFYSYLPLALASIAVFAMILLAFRHAVDRVKANEQFRRAVLLGAITVGATSVPVLAYDWVMNGVPLSSARAEATRAVAEATADDEYRPSSMQAGDSARTLQMYGRGVSLRQLLLDEDWVWISARSILGVYGYMNITPPRSVLAITLIASLTLGILILLVVSRQMARETVPGIPLAIIAGLATSVTAALSFSWFYDFQPQGRYLLSTLPVFGGALVLAGNAAWHSPALRVAAIAAFFASAWSFLIVYLPSIPKVPGVF